MKWSILILTMQERTPLLSRLLGCLSPQVEKFPDVEIVTKTSSHVRSVADQRQEMLDHAKGEYVNFIDDDDLVAHNYVDSIYPLLDGVDYIGFPVNIYCNGVFFGVSYHSLAHKEWKAHQSCWFRDISHLNPIRRELALKAKMEGGYGEDYRWANELRRLGVVKTSHYVPEAMYYYYRRG